MTDEPADLSGQPWLAGKSALVQWSILVALSGLLAIALQTAQLPAALLLGPMVAAILVASRGAGLRVPRPVFLAAQGVVGCLIGRTVTPSTARMILSDGFLFMATVLAVILASGLVGWLLGRLRILPITTAVWGSSPGGATAMTLMAAHYGADVHLVALMQYLRVVLVVLVAAIVTRLVASPADAAALAMPWFPALHPALFVETLAIAGLGAVAGLLMRIPAGSMLVPMVVAGLLSATGWIDIELPRWFLVPCYGLIGWNIGLRFTHAVLVEAARALPRIIASTLALILLCGGIGAVLSLAAPIDPLTAFLATCPGGIESVAIIAGSGHVDMPFVMAMQATRVILVLIIGPGFARLVTQKTSA